MGFFDFLDKARKTVGGAKKPRSRQEIAEERGKRGGGFEVPPGAFEKYKQEKEASDIKKVGDAISSNAGRGTGKRVGQAAITKELDRIESDVVGPHPRVKEIVQEAFLPEPEKEEQLTWPGTTGGNAGAAQGAAQNVSQKLAGVSRDQFVENLHPDHRRLQAIMDSAGRDKDLDNAVKHISVEAKKNGIDPEKATDFATTLVKVSEVLGEANVLKEIADLAKGSTLPKTDPTGKPMSEEPGMESETTLRRKHLEQQYINALSSLNKAPEMRSFWSVALFFLTSMLMGVKNAAMLFKEEHDKGTLDAQLKFYEARLKQAERAEMQEQRLQEQARWRYAGMSQRQQMHDERMDLQRQRLYQMWQDVEARAKERGQDKAFQALRNSFMDVMREISERNDLIRVERFSMEPNEEKILQWKNEIDSLMLRAKKRKELIDRATGLPE